MESKELVFVKPDGVERKLVGKVISRFEENGFKILKLKKGMISMQLAEKLYPDSVEQLTGMGSKTLKSMHERGEDQKIIEIFGTKDPMEIGRQLNQWNRTFATSAEVVAMILLGDDAPKRARALIGNTDPSKAEKGTIRGDFANDSIYQGNMERRACRNIVHASDEERAPIETKLFEDEFF
ncbi:MAG: nucleoside-diphosphate kinase [Candidatus Micrarchaeaceae archaeon]